MTKAAPKLALTPPQTIPLDKLVLHEGNVRQIKAGVSIESLAADIERRGLLQSLSVRPILNEAGEETGAYGVQAGGRRLRALQLLVKQKKLAKNAPVPCIVRSEGFVEADSLAENTEREALHPLDQFRAFKALADKGEGEETIAAAFNVSAHVVKQRLRLAKASPVLLQAYEDDEINLDQLMAFCLTDDHERQEQVFDAIQKQWNKGADAIRRMLTEKTVHAGDRRAIFVSADAYKAAGGIIIRDLFDDDEGGYLQDVPLLERLVSEKLAAEAEALKAEGWGWVEAAVDFPVESSPRFQGLEAAFARAHRGSGTGSSRPFSMSLKRLTKRATGPSRMRHGAIWLFARSRISKTARLFSTTRKRPRPEPSSAFAMTACFSSSAAISAAKMQPTSSATMCMS